MRAPWSCLLIFFALVHVALAAQASTTRYFDGQVGACGCGTNGQMSSWQTGISSGVFTAAASQNVFDSSGGTFCGPGCGLCFRLTSTGKSPCGTCGAGGAAGQSVIVMVTNLCPPVSPNTEWCPPAGSVNQHGFSTHFDIMSQGPFIWDNAVVNFTQVSCPSQATTDFRTCQCA